MLVDNPEHETKTIPPATQDSPDSHIWRAQQIAAIIRAQVGLVKQFREFTAGLVESDMDTAQFLLANTIVLRDCVVGMADKLDEQGLLPDDMEALNFD